MRKKRISFKEVTFSILTFLCGTESKHVDRTAFWTMILAVFTSTLFILGYREIAESHSTRNAQFLMDFNHFTSTDDERQMTMLLDNHLLTFKENNTNVDTVQGVPQNFGCFVINKSYPTINALLLDTGKILYSSYEMDDIVLNKFDALATYEKNGVVNIRDIYPLFHYYIFLLWENREVQKYFEWLKKLDPKQDYFKDLKSLYDKLKSYEKKHPEVMRQTE